MQPAVVRCVGHAAAAHSKNRAMRARRARLRGCGGEKRQQQQQHQQHHHHQQQVQARAHGRRCALSLVLLPLLLVAWHPLRARAAAGALERAAARELAATLSGLSREELEALLTRIVDEAEREEREERPLQGRETRQTRSQMQAVRAQAPVQQQQQQQRQQQEQRQQQKEPRAGSPPPLEPSAGRVNRDARGGEREQSGASEDRGPEQRRREQRVEPQRNEGGVDAAAEQSAAGSKAGEEDTAPLLWQADGRRAGEPELEAMARGAADAARRASGQGDKTSEGSLDTDALLASVVGERNLEAAKAALGMGDAPAGAGEEREASRKAPLPGENPLALLRSRAALRAVGGIAASGVAAALAYVVLRRAMGAEGEDSDDGSGMSPQLLADGTSEVGGSLLDTLMERVRGLGEVLQKDAALGDGDEPSLKPRLAPRLQRQRDAELFESSLEEAPRGERRRARQEARAEGANRAENGGGGGAGKVLWTRDEGGASGTAPAAPEVLPEASPVAAPSTGRVLWTRDESQPEADVVSAASGAPRAEPEAVPAVAPSIGRVLWTREETTSEVDAVTDVSGSSSEEEDAAHDKRRGERESGGAEYAEDTLDASDDIDVAAEPASSNDAHSGERAADGDASDASDATAPAPPVRNASPLEQDSAAPAAATAPGTRLLDSLGTIEGANEALNNAVEEKAPAEEALEAAEPVTTRQAQLLDSLGTIEGALEALDNAVEESGFETREGSEA